MRGNLVWWEKQYHEQHPTLLLPVQAQWGVAGAMQITSTAVGQASGHFQASTSHVQPAAHSSGLHWLSILGSPGPCFAR
jgi:hypothetical protein